MQNQNQERRSEPRSTRSITVVVKGRDSADDFWKETTSIETLSRVGASFELEKEVQVGRVVSLIMNMPKDLRCYDQEKKLYRVWGLVQHCSSSNADPTNFHTGVAFIGKHAPESYLANPTKSYRIVGMDEDGFWSVGESKTPFVSRAHFRFSIVVPVKLKLKDPEADQLSFDSDAVTENVSAQGASVFSKLEVETGDAIEFECSQYDFSTTAVVRNRQFRECGRTTVHLEFIDSEFPIKEASLGFEDDEEFIADSDEELSDETAESESETIAEHSPAESVDDSDNQEDDEDSPAIATSEEE